MPAADKYTIHKKPILMQMPFHEERGWCGVYEIHLQKSTLQQGFSRTPTYILPSREEQDFVLKRTDTYSRCGFVFLACNASAKPIICDIKECFIPHHEIPYSIAWDQEICLIGHKVQKCSRNLLFL